MRTGEIFYWTTDKARGYEARPKYHIFICDEDWEYGHTFLFINSDNYGQDFLIEKAECNFLEKPISYVSCSDPVFYSADELKRVKPDHRGRLNAECMQRLRAHIAASYVLEERYIRRVCTALDLAIAGE
jgi:hypothetical protein